MYIRFSLITDKEQIQNRQKGLDLPRLTDPEEFDLTGNSAESILTLARSFGLKEDYVWNIRLAKVLREAGHYSAAVPLFRASLHQDEQPWRAAAGLSIAYIDQGRWKDAIGSRRHELEILERNPDLLKRYSQTYENDLLSLAFCYEKLEDHVNLLEAYHKVHQRNPKNYQCATQLAKLLRNLGRKGEALEVIEEAEKDFNETTGNTRLVDWFLDLARIGIGGNLGPLTDTVIDVSRQSRPNLIQETYKTAMRVAKKMDAEAHLVLLAYYGNLLLQWCNQSEKASKIFEKVMETAKDSYFGTVFYDCRVMVADRLCNVYIDRAIKAGKDSVVAAQCMSNLASLWAVKAKPGIDLTVQAPDLEEVVRSTGKNTLALGLLYQLFGREQEARQLFRDHVKLGLDLLTDDDEENDWQGYERLFDVLVKANDDRGATAASNGISPKLNLKGRGVGVEEWLQKANSSPWPNVEASEIGAGHDKQSGDAEKQQQHIAEIEHPDTSSCSLYDLTKTTEEHGNDDATIGKAELTGFDYYFICDGICGKTSEVPDGIYACRYCLNTDFEAGCYRLLVEDKLPMNICDSQHEFFRRPDMGRPTPKGVLFVGGGCDDGTGTGEGGKGDRYIRETDWLAELRRVWDL